MMQPHSFADTVGINAYSITASRSEVSRDPADWTLEASNDGETWTLLDSRSGETFSNRYATQFYMTGEQGQSRESFTTYRLTVTAVNGGNQLQIGELQLLQINSSDPTGIREIDNPDIVKSSNSLIYDLSGRQILNGKWSNAKSHGVFIKDGKKVLIK